MDYRRLGSSGLKVSSICLGAMNFGDQTTAAVAARIVASAYDAGINFIDTADSYDRGESERIVGRLIAKQRDRWVLNNRVVTAVLGRTPNSSGANTWARSLTSWMRATTRWSIAWWRPAICPPRATPTQSFRSAAVLRVSDMSGTIRARTYA